ncbi:MAG TPA: DUF3379 family protein [Steroidobacteraceae bacterium]|jgi:hypothetical protein
MNCNDAHLAIGAEPGATSPALEEHLRACASCARYHREMRELDENIHRALKLDMASLRSDAPARPAVRLVTEAPPPGRAAAPQRASHSRSSWALAASLLIGLVAVLFFWGALPAHSLASDIVTHVLSEPTDVSPSTLAVVLERTRLQLDSLPGEVVFAETCFFRGRLVPHFIVRTTQGPVTVMILPEERVRAPEHFDESGYHGVVIPDNEHGSIAVLSRAHLDADAPAREILIALHSKSRT